MIASVLFAALLASTGTPAVMQWSIQAVPGGGEVHFDIRYSADPARGYDEDGRSYPIAGLESQFRGLTQAQLFSTGASVRFDVVRQEGTIACTGRATGGTASGDFTYSLDPNFAAELQRRGVGVVSPERQREWLMDGGDVYGLLDAFQALGDPAPGSELLSRAMEHGVDADYVRALRASGMRGLSVEQIVRAHDHGVSPHYLKAVAAYGFTNLAMDQAIALADHGVSANYLDGLGRLGYRVTPDQAIELADHGVSIHYIEKLRSNGYTNLSPNELIRLADHGVH